MTGILMDSTNYFRGAVSGFLFGTVGIFLIAFAGSLAPVLRPVTSIVLWPERFLAGLLWTGSAPLVWWIIILLYAFTAVVYAVLGMIVQYVVLHVRKKQ